MPNVRGGRPRNPAALDPLALFGVLMLLTMLVVLAYRA
ncbi:hypothetical protein EV193_12118 [Herbihabitans rhizosphaerae]|uniref:Uncharacterized protein n=1 Tax=Herbihabitans rhizosphaerae TaxID=1872711 RepID=A0A4Q7KBH9_9PSEU|nr:hypothetical protein EV193_12118 [Herbihabitans rhizosphaerae]